ncbi:MAG: 30S ribosomal protein S20 [Planctomycetes bacterium]|nr:30S ribosomal protein S20 [Planctomycetota bacterium]
MAHSLSAKKRIRQNLKARARNRWRKGQVKDSTKGFLDAVHDGDPAKAAEAYQKLTKTLDQVAAAGSIHKNAAARRKSRLAKRLNALKAAKAS